MFRLLLFLLVFSIGYSQQPEVVSVKTTERTFHGFVDKYPITMSLKVDTFSKDHDSIYSVKGWYMYDNKQIKIPLVGIYDGDLILYHFDNGADERFLTIGNNTETNIWDDLFLWKLFPGSTERFIFPDSKTPPDFEFIGTWKKEDEPGLTAKLTSSTGLKIYDEQEWLAFSDDHITSFDLHKYDIFETGFKLESWYKDTDEIRVLLYYNRHSTPNQMGMCGGANNSGFVVAHFSPNLQFLSFEKEPIESCPDFIRTEISGKNSEIYTITDENHQKKKLRIDRKKAKIITLSP